MESSNAAGQLWQLGDRRSDGVSKVRLSASAENDLLEAWLFIAEDSVEAADGTHSMRCMKATLIYKRTKTCGRSSSCWAAPSSSGQCGA